MAFPNSLRAFLSHAKKSLFTATQQSQKVTIVVGNESADLDSLTSALLYAYLRSLNPPGRAFTPLYIPLLNAPESDIGIRPEFDPLFKHANISASHIITWDDLPPPERMEEFLKPENSRWILVDHNELQGKIGSVYSGRVLGVIDHHQDENTVPQDTEPEPRLIEKCGSCTSLVVRTFKSSWDMLSSSAMSSGAGHAQGDIIADDGMVRRTWDAQLAKMALASILIDTTNLTVEDKVEAADREAVEYLEAKIHLSPKNTKTWDRSELYKEIDAAKKNIEGLKLVDILRKDYKEWTENGNKLGISSVVKPLEFIVTKARQTNSHHEPFEQGISDFMKPRSLSIYAIMTASTFGNGFRRELFLHATPRGGYVISRFAERAATELGLESLEVKGIPTDNDLQGSESGSSPTRRMWLQNDITKSRKQVAPLLRAAMS